MMIESTTPGTAESPRWIPKMKTPTTSANAATMAPFATDGNARPRKSATRFAGETTSAGRVSVNRSSAIVCDMAKRHGTAAATRAFPTMKKVSFSTSAARPRKTKKIICVTDGISSTITNSEGCSQEKRAR